MYGSIACGDAIVFSFQVEQHPTNPEQDRIIKARYQTFGCTSAIASSEALCAILEEKKMTPLEAMKITSTQIAELMGGIPKEKFHCSIMGADVLQFAVADWAKKREVHLSSDPYQDEHQHGKIVCKCFSLTDSYLKRRIEELELKNLDEIENALKAGGACGACEDAAGGLFDLLQQVWGSQSRPAEIDQVSFEDIRGPVELVIESALKPEVARLGGEIILVEVKGHKVYCHLHRIRGMRKTLEGLLKVLVHPNIELIDL
jgi:NifU-like protein